MTTKPWLERHAQTLLGSLGRIARTPAATGMTMAVIAIALALPLMFHVLLDSARSVTSTWHANEISVYMDRRSDLARAQTVAKRLRSRSDVAAVQVISADAALAQFRQFSGFGSALDTLRDNPLPVTLVVTPAPGVQLPQGLRVLEAAIAAVAGVQTVQVDTEWVMRLQGMMEIVKCGVWLSAGLLSMGVLLIIGNTIRLDILNRRAEIEVMKLVGATNGFARRPFLYSGVWYGPGGGLFALAMCQAALGRLSAPVGRLASLYGSQFRLQGPGWARGFSIIVLASLLGWMGSWLAASRHIRGISPT